MRYHPVSAALLAASLVAFAPAAPAGELVLGLGQVSYSGVRSHDAVLFSLDYNFTPFHASGAFAIGWSGAIELDTEGDAFAGIGLALRQGLGESWFLGASVLPGVYHHAGSRNDLGNVFEIRSLAEIGYRFDGAGSLALGISHKSNASTGRSNPGANALTLRWHMAL